MRASGLLPQADDRMSQSSNETIKSFNQSVNKAIIQLISQCVSAAGQ